VSKSNDFLERQSSSIGGVDDTDKEVKHDDQHPEGLTEPKDPNHSDGQSLVEVIWWVPFA
jgi:hypothetical protein